MSAPSGYERIEYLKGCFFKPFLTVEPCFLSAALMSCSDLVADRRDWVIRRGHQEAGCCLLSAFSRDAAAKSAAAAQTSGK